MEISTDALSAEAVKVMLLMSLAEHLTLASNLGALSDDPSYDDIRTLVTTQLHTLWSQFEIDRANYATQIEQSRDDMPED